jgi:hypothetical protein
MENPEDALRGPPQECWSSSSSYMIPMRDPPNYSNFESLIALALTRAPRYGRARCWKDSEGTDVALDSCYVDSKMAYRQGVRWFALP